MIQDAKMVKDTGNLKKKLNSPISQELLLLHNQVKSFFSLFRMGVAYFMTFFGEREPFFGLLGGF